MFNQIYDGLYSKYGDAKCELNFTTPFELLVAVILSAQCTDKRVNVVTESLFKKYNKPDDFASLDIETLGKEIFSCGFYATKSKNIISASKAIIDSFNGEVPRTTTELQTLDGVGRKTANVVYAVAFGGQAIAVDTHVFRVSRRIGLADKNDVLGVEKQLMEVVPQDKWSTMHHLLIHHGRYTCVARKPKCSECPITMYCKEYANNNE